MKSETTNISDYMRLRPEMFLSLKVRGTFSEKLVLCGWQALFYDVLHAFSKSRTDDGTITISFNEGEFCFVADRQIYLNDDMALVQALSESFSVIQKREETEVRFKPDKDVLPNIGFDEKIIRIILNDYAYLHPNQTIFWKDWFMHAPEGLKEMLKYEFGIVDEILYTDDYRHCLDWQDVEIALCVTNTGEHTVIDYINANRTDGGKHAVALRKAIKEQLPEIDEKGYIAAMNLQASDQEFTFDSATRGRVGFISEGLKDKIVKAVALFREEPQPSTTNMEKIDLISIIEEHPEIFYDTTELDDLNNTGEKDSVTQKTFEEWEIWIDEYMKNKE